MVTYRQVNVYLATSLCSLVLNMVPVTAASLSISVRCNWLCTIRPYSPHETTDKAYLLVITDVAGTTSAANLPEHGAWNSSQHAPAISVDKAVQLWKGVLQDGEYLTTTVILLYGDGDDDATRSLLVHGIEGCDKETLPASFGSDAAFGKAAACLHQSHNTFVRGIKNVSTRAESHAHFGGECTMMFWNNKGTLVKRLYPVGAIVGKPNSDGDQLYAMLRNTERNVPVFRQGGWWIRQLEPVSEDGEDIRVRCLQSEASRSNGGGHVTDYLMQFRVSVADQKKAIPWVLEDGHFGIDALQAYWNYAD